MSYVWILTGSLYVSISTAFELPIRHQVDGSFAVDGRAFLCPDSPPETFRMNLRMYDFSTIERSWRNCQIEFPSVIGERDLVMRHTESFINAVDGVLIFGIGPGSFFATQYGVDVIGGGVGGVPNSPEYSVLRLGSPVSEFFDNSCYPGSVLAFSLERTAVVSSAWMRFELIDSLSGTRLDASLDPQPTNLESVHDNFVATLPEFLASRIDHILVQNGAVGSVSQLGVWSYTNCSADVLEVLPTLVVEFYNRTGSDTVNLAGSIHLSPDEYMPGCAFAVGEPGLAYALDILKLPFINKRIANNTIYLCESPLAS